MYLLKNAFKSVSRTKGRRNVLILIISLLVIILSSLALSIVISTWKTSKQMYKTSEITATVVLDPSSISQGGGRNPLSSVEASLSYDQITHYGTSSHLKNYYYYLTANVGSSMTPYGGGGNNPGGGNNFGFSAVGYSSYDAMKDFVNGSSEIIMGSMFEFNENFNCLISAEVAYQNELNVGDQISIYNPSNRTEAYVFTICGIYINHESQSSQQIMQNPSNSILMSYDDIDGIVKRSYVQNVVVEQRNNPALITGNITSRFILKDEKSADAFLSDLRDMGLSQLYTIQTNANSILQSLMPAYILQAKAGNFFFIVVSVGCFLIAIINFVNIRSRKQEISTLSSIGMKRKKVILQFAAEILVITLVSLMIGTVISSIISNPAANSFLKSEVEAEEAARIQSSRGQQRRPGRNQPGTWPGGGSSNTFTSERVDYVKQINAGFDILVILSVIGVVILINLVAISASSAYIYRFSPMKALYEQS